MEAYIKVKDVEKYYGSSGNITKAVGYSMVTFVRV